MIDKLSSKKCNVRIVRIVYNDIVNSSISEIFRRITSIVGNELHAKYKVRCFIADRTKNKLELYNTDPELEDNWEKIITEFFDSITTINITKTIIDRKFILKSKEIEKTYTCKVSYIIDFKGGNIYNVYSKEG